METIDILEAGGEPYIEQINQIIGPSKSQLEEILNSTNASTNTNACILAETLRAAGITNVRIMGVTNGNSEFFVGIANNLGAVAAVRFNGQGIAFQTMGEIQSKYGTTAIFDVPDQSSAYFFARQEIGDQKFNNYVQMARQTFGVSAEA